MKFIKIDVQNKKIINNLPMWWEKNYNKNVLSENKL